MERYHRQIMMEEVGIEGQRKLLNSNVLVVGAGGLGCTVLNCLGAAGVGRIGIVDKDIVSISNLHRQFLYDSTMVGKNKVDMAKKILLKQNPQLKVDSYFHFLDFDLAHKIVDKYDILVDCTDNFETKYLINDISIIKNKILVSAGINKFEGQIAVFNYQGSGNYQDVFFQPDNSSLNCSESGVIGTLCAMVGALQANEVIKIVLEKGNVLSNKYLTIDLLNMNFNMFNYIPLERKASLNEYQKRNTRKVKKIETFEVLKKYFDRALLIDVREINESPILSNINKIPLGTLEKELVKIDKKQELIFFCKTGIRAKKAGEISCDLGFEKTYFLSFFPEQLL